MSLVRTKIQEGVAVVTLADARRRNAISLDMSAAMIEAFDRLEATPAVRAAVITGEPPAFCAGADLTDLGEVRAEGLRRIYEGFLRVERSPLPTVAAVNGAAVGAGMNLALVCDVRMAARRAWFESRFLELGLHPGGGHTWMLRQLVGPQTLAALVLFGARLDGEAAARCGLVWRCVDDAALIDEACELASRVAAAPRELVQDARATLRDMAWIPRHAEAVERELEPQLRSVSQPAFQERLAALRRSIGDR